VINFAFLVARPIQQVFSALKSNHRVVFALDRLTWRHVCANKALSDGFFCANKQHVLLSACLSAAFLGKISLHNSSKTG